MESILKITCIAGITDGKDCLNQGYCRWDIWEQLPMLVSKNYLDSLNKNQG